MDISVRMIVVALLLLVLFWNGRRHYSL